MLTNLVGAHRRNINTKFEANPCRGSREEVKNWILYTADWKVIYVHDSLKIVGNSVSNVQIAFFLVTYLGLHSLALPVLAPSSI